MSHKTGTMRAASGMPFPTGPANMLQPFVGGEQVIPWCSFTPLRTSLWIQQGGCTSSRYSTRSTNHFTQATRQRYSGKDSASRGKAPYIFASSSRLPLISSLAINDSLFFFLNEINSVFALILSISPQRDSYKAEGFIYCNHRISNLQTSLSLIISF